MSEVYDGDEYIEELKKSIIKALVLLSGKIKGLQSRKYAEVPNCIQLGVDFEAKESIDEMLDLVRKFFNGVL